MKHFLWLFYILLPFKQAFTQDPNSASASLYYLSFDVVQTGQGVKLTWKTSPEITCSRFFIERSTDGSTFVSIDSMPSECNSTTYVYTYTDRSEISGKFFYRVKTKTGKYTLTKFLMLNDDKGIELYPNPCAGNTVCIRTGELPKENFSFHILNSTGATIFSGYQRTPPILLQVTIPKEKIKPGIYFLLISGTSFNRQQSFIIQ